MKRILAAGPPVAVFLVLLIAFGLAAGGRRTLARDENRRLPIINRPEVRPSPTPQEPKRKNTRPTATSSPDAADAGNSRNGKYICDPCYEYRFEHPGRNIQSVRIVHDSAGKGFIYFSEQGMSGDLEEPLTLSEKILGRLRAAFDALDFLNSDENYQYEKDYSHLGTVTITLKEGGRQRTAKFNWTTNQWAKALMDEYRRIWQREIWLFDFARARENQPLETPKLVDTLETLLDRGEIADPAQMLPILRKYETDERLPLIARNHLSRMATRIEKLKPAK